MQIIKICLIILITAVAVNFIKNGETFHLAKILPFANKGDNVDLYDWAGVAVLAIFAWGLYRLHRNSNDNE